LLFVLEKPRGFDHLPWTGSVSELVEK